MPPGPSTREDPVRASLVALIAHLRTEHTDPIRMGVAVALGVFVGLLPLYGLHALSCLVLASALRLNRLTMVLASNVSLPFVAPFIVAAGLAIGETVRFGELRPVSLADARDFLSATSILAGAFPDRFLSCLLGDALLGLVLGPSAGLVAWRWAGRRADQRSR